MARRHARAFRKMDGVTLAGAVEPVADLLAEFAAEFDIPDTFAELDQAIAWGNFDAASNVTPDAVHHPTTMTLVAAGKHVLCEKPLSTSYPLALEMTEAAEAAGIVNMVNLTYRSSPAAIKARELVAAGEIGNLRHFDAAYLQSWLVSRGWGDWHTEGRWLWRLSQGHGSQGVVGDIGVHLIDLATFVFGREIVRMQSRTANFHKAEGDRIGDYVLDANDTFTIGAELAGGAVGVIHATRWAPGHVNDLRLDLFGDRGGIRLRADGDESSLAICAGADVDPGTWRDVACPPVPSLYEAFAAAIRTGESTGPSFREAARVQRLLDLCLEAGETGSGLVEVR